MPIDLMGKFLALFCAVLWAVAVIFFKRAGESIRPIALNFYKTAVAALLLLPVFWLTGDSLLPLEVTGKDWLSVAFSGILGIAVADSLFFKCLNLLGAGLTAIVECLYSPMVILLSWLILFDRLTAQQVAGGLLVTAAVLIAALKANKSAVPARRVLWGIFLGAGAMFLMGLGIVLMKPVLEKASLFWVAEIRLAAALMVLLGFMLVNKGRGQMLDSLKDRRNWRHAFPGTVLGNFLSMTIWVAAFKLTDVSSAAVLNQTNAIFIVILASLWLKEPFTARRILATLLAFAGSVLVLTSQASG